MGPKFEPTLILVVLQSSDSQSAMPILKIILASNNKQIQAYISFTNKSKNYWEIPGMFGCFLGFLFSHSKLGIPFTWGQKGFLYLQTAPH